MPHRRMSEGARVAILVLLAGLTACGDVTPGAAIRSDTAGPTAPHTAVTGPPPGSGIATEAVVPVAGEAWLAYEDATFRIRLVRPDGTGDHALDSVTTGAEDNPDWSPDGQWLAFVGEGADAGSNAGLWVIRADGVGLRRVVECADPCRYVDDPAWSPDGSELLYSRPRPGTTVGGTLEAADVATGRTRTVLTGKPGDFFAGVRYAPSGRAVVLELVHARTDDYDDITGVEVTHVDLSVSPPRLTALTRPELLAETPDWSPRGDQIVYAAPPVVGGDGRDLHLVRPDGSGRRRLTALTETGGGALHPDFSNDAKTVVFLGSDGTTGRAGFTTVDIATGRLSPTLASDDAFGHHPRSRPVP